MWQWKRAAAPKRSFDFDAKKKSFKSCCARVFDSHIGLAGRAAIRDGTWLNSAKGGDPMSHGSAQRSVIRSAEHYR
jgi:hypothetical protein